MRRLAVFIMVLSAALSALAGTAEGRQIVARTEVTKWGQLPVSFEISGQTLPEGVTPQDFAITGEATAWGASSLHPFACGVQAVEATAEGWRLTPEQFPDKYFYVKQLAIACEGHPELGFTLADIGQTQTAVADDFQPLNDPEHQLTAHVFLPEADGPVPVVIVFHGYGDTANLLTYRTAVAWADPESQAKRPCAVIAPSIPDSLYTSEFVRSKVFEGVLNWIDGQIEAGRIDGSRIYAMGNSFGGMSTFELAEQHPDRIAAILALCPALNYSAHSTQRLGELTDIPVTICQAEHDETIPVEVGRGAAEALTAAGNGHVTLRVYSDEEMYAAGAALGQENTYSFHHVELAALEGEEFEANADWLFAQGKE